MGQITIEYPDEYHDDLVSGLRTYLGEGSHGLSDTDAARKALKRFAKHEAKGVIRRGATSLEVANADAALADKEKAATAAVQARKTAETASDDAVEAAFGEDS